MLESRATMILMGMFAMIASNGLAATRTARALVRRLPRCLVRRVARFLPTPAIVRAASRQIRAAPRLATAGMLATACLVAATPTPARADFLDDMRRTFKSDIPKFVQKDVTNFFQDDVPCAFGGKPTSGTRPGCKSAPDAPPKQGSEPPAPPAPQTNPETRTNRMPASPLPA
jgi:hypothetical protein